MIDFRRIINRFVKWNQIETSQNNLSSRTPSYFEIYKEVFDPFLQQQ